MSVSQGLVAVLAGGLAMGAGAGCGKMPAAPTDDMSTQMNGAMDAGTPDLAVVDLFGVDQFIGGPLCVDPRADNYVPGMTKTSANNTYRVTLEDSQPGPPYMGSNLWNFRVVDQGGNPVDGATITAKPWMPDHGHGTAIKPVSMGQGGGAYTLYPLYLFMAGLWETTVTITPASGAADTVVFSFCLADTNTTGP